jgi:TRAP-type C4-dicarboxylate transport system permease large subunit
MVLNLMIGLLTPPVGIVLYILSRVAGISFERTVTACAPWLIPLTVALALVVIFPQLTLFVPSLAYK